MIHPWRGLPGRCTYKIFGNRNFPSANCFLSATFTIFNDMFFPPGSASLSKIVSSSWVSVHVVPRKVVRYHSRLWLRTMYMTSLASKYIKIVIWNHLKVNEVMKLVGNMFLFEGNASSCQKSSDFKKHLCTLNTCTRNPLYPYHLQFHTSNFHCRNQTSVFLSNKDNSSPTFFGIGFLLLPGKS